MKPIIITLVLGTVFVFGTGMHRQSGPSHQQRFLKAVGSRDMAKISELITPELRERIDGVVAAAWLDAVNERLGSVRQIHHLQLRKSGSSDGLVTESVARVRFERGQAKCSLTVVNNQVQSFRFISADLGEWFTEILDDSIFATRGEDFLRNVFAGESRQAWESCHASLQEKLPASDLQKLSDLVAKKAGAIKSISLVDSTWNGRNLSLDYKIETQQSQDLTATVEMEVIELRAELMAFRIQ